MFKWLTEWKKSKEIYPIVIQGYNWDTCFITVSNAIRFVHGGHESLGSHNAFIEIKYSGRIITTNDFMDLYECLIEGKIKWVNKNLLSFPKSL